MVKSSEAVKSTAIPKSVSARKHVIVGESEHRRAKMIAAETGGHVTDLVSRLINDEYNRYRRIKSEKSKQG